MPPKSSQKRKAQGFVVDREALFDYIAELSKNQLKHTSEEASDGGEDEDNGVPAERSNAVYIDTGEDRHRDVYCSIKGCSATLSKNHFKGHVERVHNFRPWSDSFNTFRSIRPYTKALVGLGAAFADGVRDGVSETFSRRSPSRRR
jgi:hypothetical protein